MGKDALISIVVPVYNTGAYLRRCLDSILSQTYGNLEVICVNDKSTGNEEEILQEYVKLDDRIKIVEHEENKGLFQARVSGAKKATGEYLAFIDSDDYVSCDYYRTLMEKAITENFDIVSGNTVRELMNGDKVQFTLHTRALEKTLYGNSVRDTFFEQEGACFSWHTVWNKIYKKSLWDICASEYETITKHLIMTEDIAFSSLLFYNAQSYSFVRTGAYFYCENSNASTNSEGMSLKKFKKNVEDISTVFDFVEEYLLKVNASDTIRHHVGETRKYYYRMWSNIEKDIFTVGKDKKEAKNVLEKLYKGYQGKMEAKDYYFDSIMSKWYKNYEVIKEMIADEEIEIVSFDIFDTLIVRPLWYPEDVFLLMQEQFEQICGKANSFKKIRMAAERIARANVYKKNLQYEDVTLNEIYEVLEREFNISHEKANLMMQKEEGMELNLIQCRKAGKELLDYAKYIGKKVILVSDMYLGKEQIEKMLHKNDIKNYDCLYVSSDVRKIKCSGNLFEYVLQDLNVKPSKMLHIGDNWQVDILAAQKKAIRTAFVPKTKDRFTNNFAECPTSHLGDVACLSGGFLTTWNKLNESLGYRTLLTMVANKLFDNPFEHWDENSYMGTDPYVVGYYAVGMHMLGITKWLIDQARDKDINEISFLGRDGYLPIRAFNILSKYFGIEDINVNYVPCSRLALMPWIIVDEDGLYNLPVNYRSHTPLSLVDTLSCCVEEKDVEMQREKISEAGYFADMRFNKEEEYFDFINWFRKNLFSEKALNKSKEIVSKYYRSQIKENSLVFDLGYSGRIPAALKKCLSQKVTFAYVHKDDGSFSDYKRRESMDIEVLYSLTPQNFDLIREFILSDPQNQCIGIEEKEDKVIDARYAASELTYSELFAVRKIVEGTQEFLADFVDIFENIDFDFDAIQISMPFEGFMANCPADEKKIFAASFTEDFIFGNSKKISVLDFWKSLGDERTHTHNIVRMVEDSRNLEKMMQKNTKLQRAIVYAITDSESFKRKLRLELSTHKSMAKMLKSLGML